MSHPLDAAFYADQAVQKTVAVQLNERLARDTYRVRFACPEIAARIVPGQFVMLRLSGCNDPLIARPLALYDTVASDTGAAEGLDLVYLVKGKLTSRLVHWQPGQLLDVWGPLGNGFRPLATSLLVMVAGGIGYTPFLALAKEYLGLQRYGTNARQAARAKRVTLCYGARTEALLAGIGEFERVGVDVQVATDDGTRGHCGLVTDLLPALLAEISDVRVVCCGPEPMMKAVAARCAAARVPCQVSLETPMACGIGICFTCVAPVRDAAGGWDYRRTCVEGPVFEGSEIYDL